MSPRKAVNGGRVGGAVDVGVVRAEDGFEWDDGGVSFFEPAGVVGAAIAALVNIGKY